MSDLDIRAPRTWGMGAIVLGVILLVYGMTNRAGGRSSSSSFPMFGSSSQVTTYYPREARLQMALGAGLVVAGAFLYRMRK